MKDSLKKILPVLLIVGLNWSGLSAIGTAWAYYNDTESSTGSGLQAGTLVLSLDADEWQPSEKASGLMPGDSVQRNISVTPAGSLGMQYIVNNLKTAGDDSFCNALQLQAKLNSVEVYNGSLMNFITTSTVLAVTSTDDWLFTLSLPSNSSVFASSSCEFKFVFNAWQENLAFGAGFNDTGAIENIIEGGGIIAETSGISPIADAYVYEQNPDNNFGGQSDINIKSEKSKNRRIFIKFNFKFPTSTDIISSALKLFMSVAPNSNRAYEIRTVSDAWTENGITWNNQPAVSPSSTDSILSSTTSNIWLQWSVTGDVQNFVSGTSSNYGWRLKDVLESASTTQEGKFFSRENGNDTHRPILEVTFSAPPATTSHLVINEVYFDVANGKGSNSKNEWVEIYNPTDTTVDITGWKICDNSACDTIPSATPIPAKGFAVISKEDSTWGYWTIPTGAIKIELGSYIGGGLANDGDRVILKDAADVVVDAMSYASDNSQLNPAIMISGDGKSLARIVKGYDTDTADDWVSNATPNPGTNPSIGGIETVSFTSEGMAFADGLAVGGIIDELLLVDETSNTPEMEEAILNSQADQLRAGGDSFSAVANETSANEGSLFLTSNQGAVLGATTDSDTATTSTVQNFSASTTAEISSTTDSTSTTNMTAEIVSTTSEAVTIEAPSGQENSLTTADVIVDDDTGVGSDGGIVEQDATSREELDVTGGVDDDGGQNSADSTTALENPPATTPESAVIPDGSSGTISDGGGAGSGDSDGITGNGSDSGGEGAGAGAGAGAGGEGVPTI